MKVYEALADAFVKEGTSDVFGMMGDANMHWMAALADRGVRLYEVRHEGSGLGMADGWARGSGQPGVVTTTSGPGVSQLATSMLCASRAGTPLVAFCGETPLGDEGPPSTSTSGASPPRSSARSSRSPGPRTPRKPYGTPSTWHGPSPGRS